MTEKKWVTATVALVSGGAALAFLAAGIKMVLALVQSHGMG